MAFNAIKRGAEIETQMYDTDLMIIQLESDIDAAIQGGTDAGDLAELRTIKAKLQALKGKLRADRSNIVEQIREDLNARKNNELAKG